MISEKIELLGKGLYEDIPDTLTLKNIPTASELDYIGSEDFDKVMLEKILPLAIEEDIDCNKLLEIDYQWICRCLRLVNYGPYYTTNAIFCRDCGSTSYGEYQVNLNTIGCIPLPEGFVNNITISRDEFIEYDGDVTFRLPTIKQVLNAYSDKAFRTADGRVKRDFAKMCYMITSLKGNKALSPLQIKLSIEKDFCSADFEILKNSVNNLINYGLRAGGVTQCPKCRSMEATFIALPDDKFFRPSLGDLKQWRDDRRKGGEENATGAKAKTV